MSPTQLSTRPQRRLLCLALLTALASPAFAGDNCQLVDSTGAVPIDSTSAGDKSLACGPYASATGDSAVAMGEQTSASGRNATAVGSWIDLDGDGRVDPDEITWAQGTYATAIGAAAQALGNASTVLGVRAVANAYADTTATQTLTRANAYTDSRYQTLSDEFTDLKSDIGYRLGRQDERIDRQGAMSAAMMNMSTNAANSRSPRGRVAVGAGWQNGESALSVGYSKAIGERASLSIGGAFSSDDSAAGVGFGIDL